MNRQIKFRAWDNVDFMTKPFTLEDIVMGRTRFAEMDSTLMQYTGLKDKNDKEIYEGDIVRWKQASGGVLSPDENTYICQIKWSRTGWACEEIKALKDDYHSRFTLIPSHLEVIGNIYENPELLDNDKVIK